MAPRAAALEKAGERARATELLGRYLATAPDDGNAWFQLGRFYLLNARDWHKRGHTGEPPVTLYLDFAATALDQAVRLVVDSGVVFRAMVELDRTLVFVEDSGWEAARARRQRPDVLRIPDYLAELGNNLLRSCPANGVLVTGSDLETLAVWYAALEEGHRPDVQPVEPGWYSSDSLYRRQMASALDVDASWPASRALAAASSRRPLCLSPLGDSSLVPGPFAPVRLVRVTGPARSPTPDVLTITEFIAFEQRGTSVWAAHVRAIYSAAARYNALLCGGLLAQLGDRPLGACGM